MFKDPEAESPMEKPDAQQEYYQKKLEEEFAQVNLDLKAMVKLGRDSLRSYLELQLQKLGGQIEEYIQIILNVLGPLFDDADDAEDAGTDNNPTKGNDRHENQ